MGAQANPTGGWKPPPHPWTPEREIPPVPTCTVWPVAKSKEAMRLVGSVAGASYSYRNPRFNVRLRVTFQSSCTYAASDLVRRVWGPVYWDLMPYVGSPSRRSAIPEPVNAPVKYIWPRLYTST